MTERGRLKWVRGPEIGEATGPVISLPGPAPGNTSFPANTSPTTLATKILNNQGDTPLPCLTPTSTPSLSLTLPFLLHMTSFLEAPTTSDSFSLTPPIFNIFHRHDLTTLSYTLLQQLPHKKFFPFLSLGSSGDFLTPAPPSGVISPLPVRHLLQCPSPFFIPLYTLINSTSAVCLSTRLMPCISIVSPYLKYR